MWCLSRLLLLWFLLLFGILIFLLLLLPFVSLFGVVVPQSSSVSVASSSIRHSDISSSASSVSIIVC